MGDYDDCRFESSAWLVASLLSRNIGSVFSPPESLQQRRAYSTFRDTNPQLVRTNPDRSRHRLGQAFVPTLHEPVAQVAQGRFEPTDVLRPAPFLRLAHRAFLRSARAFLWCSQFLDHAADGGFVIVQVNWLMYTFECTK